MYRLTAEERRARLGRRHGLIDKLPSVADAAEAMTVLHATDPASVYLSAMARVIDPSLETVSRALYDERSVVRILAMRRTLFIVPVAYLPVIERSSSSEVAERERKRLQRALADSDVAAPATWIAAARHEIELALTKEGLPARALTAKVPMLATKILIGAGTKNATETGSTSRVLGLLAVEGHLMRGRPAGDWTGRQYQWHLRRCWLEDGGSDPGLDYGREEASTELVRRWLRTFGPGTFGDLKWWTGWKVPQLRSALSGVDVVEVDLDGSDGLILADDLEPIASVGPWVALLPSLDPTPMGWKERSWYLGPHQPRLFDRNGNIGPTIWVDGRIVGGWGQRADGSIVTRLLEDVGRDHLALVEAEVTQLQGLIGSTVVRPSFPTPLQRELAA